MIGALIAILAGVLLLADSLGKFRGLDALVRTLRPYQTVIGILALCWGIFHVFSLLGVVLILAGVILGANALVTVPRVGDDFSGAARALAPFAMIIGVAALVFGLIRLF
jgi:uncharacterized membrane protein